MFLLGLILPTAAQAQNTIQSTRKTDRNITAQQFIDTFGVNLHLGENNYRNVQAIADALNIIGFSRVRLKCTDAADVAATKDLAAKTTHYFPAGLKADVLLIGYLNAPDVTLDTQKETVPQISALIEFVEGPNEINNYSTGNGTHGPFDKIDRTRDFPSNYAAWASAVDNWRKSIPALSAVKLLAPDIASGDPEDYARLPNVSPHVALGNFHFYGGNGRQPSGFGGGNFAAIYDWYKAAAVPSKPVSLTEWGQTTASQPGQGGCDELTQAKYILNQMCDLTSKGVSRAYLYQLMDDTADGDPTGRGGAEAHFGIFDYQWRAKPAAQALATIKNLLAETPRAARKTHYLDKVPGLNEVPDYHVTGVTQPGAAGSSFSISKNDGSMYLVIWNEPQIWEPKTNLPVTPLADLVRVELGGSYAYQVVDPLIGLQPIASGTGSRLTLSLSGSPLFIHIIPQLALR